MVLDGAGAWRLDVWGGASGTGSAAVELTAAGAKGTLGAPDDVELAAALATARLSIDDAASVLKTTPAPQAWKDYLLGVQVAESSGWWVKRVNPNAGFIMSRWGQPSIRAQHEGLGQLGDMATPYFAHEGMLFTKDVGPKLASGFSRELLKARLVGTYRMGTLVNDIKPDNMGANGLVFDPAFDPFIRGMVYTAVPAGLGFGVGAGWVTP